MMKYARGAIIMCGACLFMTTQAHAFAQAHDFAILLAQQGVVAPSSPTSLAPSLPSYSGALIRMLLALCAVLLLLVTVAWLLPRLFKAKSQKRALVGSQDGEIVMVASKALSPGTVFHVVSWRGVEYGVVSNQRGSTAVTILQPHAANVGSNPAAPFEVRLKQNLDETMILPVEGLGQGTGSGGGSGGSGGTGRVGTPV